MACSCTGMPVKSCAKIKIVLPCRINNLNCTGRRRKDHLPSENNERTCVLQSRVCPWQFNGVFLARANHNSVFSKICVEWRGGYIIVYPPNASNGLQRNLHLIRSKIAKFWPQQALNWSSFPKITKKKIFYKIKYDLKTFVLKKTFLEFYPRVWASNQASFEFFLRWRVTKGNVMKPPLGRNSASLLWARRA